MKNPLSRRGWKETQATVYTCGVQNHYDAGFGQAYISSDYLIVFSYEIDGHWYSGEFNAGKPWVEGSKFTIKYDPANPEQNTFSGPQTLPGKILWWTISAAIAAALLWLKIHYFP